ncbi:hypothetical protein GCK72_018777 [Caenorhabditis remanei]|uniref:Glycosyltransferase family 92 protein n=1 Tax=Caenorhabditis remanei TaxID=31234 RepID=A0A6A5GC36_CAERE|nr:hypothetical protein GCK72_018777 [Caenorhabditis remanei]KAF1752223.1 hypothetical protein GCK72_018777 [Caenorhabditis remanei]
MILVFLVFLFCFYLLHSFTKNSKVRFTRQDSENSVDILEGTTAPPISEYLLSKESERLTRKLSVSQAFVVSAYFYPTSKSLGENAIALNMVVDSINFDSSNYEYSFVGSNETHSESGLAVSQTQSNNKCRYASSVATGNSLDNLTKLELESNGTRVEIPFKIARYTAPKPVIICVSPQFVAEQWPIFIMHAHTAHRFGGHMHIYVTSIIHQYFDLMKEYERQGYVTMEMWLRMKFEQPGSKFFEPNLNTELRNQAGAASDCLLQYKEAAEYIAFFDMNDLLFPVHYPTYLEEFNAIWAQKPNATSLVYKQVEHEFLNPSNLSEYSFHELVASLRTSSARSFRVVVKPVLHNSIGIHGSDWEDPNTRSPISISAFEFISHISRIHVASPHIIHVKNPVWKNKTKEFEHIRNPRFWIFNETIHQNDVIAIHDDILRLKTNKKISRVGPSLPSEDFYSPIIFQCFVSQFYGKPLEECPNAEKCTLPQRKNTKCMHTNAEYISGPPTHPFTFHFFRNPIWSSEYGCYQ